ncbi:hypothetical protein HKO22_09635 [Peptoniphilus sp. AGMB00490]|uniref:Phage replisome organizer, putative, N-terminal region n=1 Tax=Peptoniphilus faecalis TaxID=2731255 RepID=A0A848RKF8_9FIRM|nr:hypothetical protein [Peptoniphilus faecalis]NMW85983.1 hypothetical protein [Peptoniphilus faecalis]
MINEVFLRDDFLDNDVIQRITNKYGYMYISLYLKLLILSMDNDGYLKIEDINTIDASMETINEAIEILVSENLIDVISENEYFFKQAEVVRY